MQDQADRPKVIEDVETQRLLLRAPTLGGVGELVALDSNPAVMRYINGGRPTPRTEDRSDRSEVAPTPMAGPRPVQRRVHRMVLATPHRPRAT
jgi:hypothetical protein